jgi:hypothetical protein
MVTFTVFVLDKTTEGEGVYKDIINISTVQSATNIYIRLDQTKHRCEIVNIKPHSLMSIMIYRDPS